MANSVYDKNFNVKTHFFRKHGSELTRLTVPSASESHSFINPMEKDKRRPEDCHIALVPRRSQKLTHLCSWKRTLWVRMNWRAPTF